MNIRTILQFRSIYFEKFQLKQDIVTVSAKHKETKQYYTLYNTLDDTKLYISKELSLLNSIQDNYNEYVSIALIYS